MEHHGILLFHCTGVRIRHHVASEVSAEDMEELPRKTAEDGCWLSFFS